MTESTMPVTGEEWRDMFGVDGVYDPTANADIVNQARENIEAVRKTTVTLGLTDAVGRPRPQTRVRIKLARHSFPFGNNTGELEQFYRYHQMPTARAAAWQRAFLDVFNASNHMCYWTEREQNDLCKTETRQGHLLLDDFGHTVDWALSNDLITKGHPLYWAIPKCVPDWVKRYDYPTQWKFAEVRVRNILARFRGKVKYWDAVNEALWEARLRNLPERVWPHLEPVDDIADDIAEVLGWCRSEDPDAVYIVNDYGMVGPESPRGPANDGSMVTASMQRKRMVQLMHALARRDAAPDGLGMQSHTGAVEHDLQWQCYEELAQPGIPLHITEFWLREKDIDPQGRLRAEQAAAMQAAYVENFLTVAFGHPKIAGIFLWGFTNWAIDWHKAEEHTLRPVYHTVRRLIRQQWHTELEAETDADGVVQFRGFKGRYDVRIGDFATAFETGDDAEREVHLSL